MKAGALLFRFRVFIFVLLYLLGFLAPWDPRSGSRDTSGWRHRRGWRAPAGSAWHPPPWSDTRRALLPGGGGHSAGVGYRVPWFRRHERSSLQGDTFVAAGPYRYLRNPLYLGAWLLALDVSILMPPSGAAFFLPPFSIYILFLISAEERFLAMKQGDLYQQYRRRVPRLLPRRPAGNITSSGRPRWVQAFLTRLIQLPSRFALRSSPGDITRAS